MSALLLEQGGNLLLQGGGILLLHEVAVDLGPLAILIDWNADSDFSGEGEDVSERVDGDAGQVWSRGKDQIRQFAPAAAGQLAFVLHNISEDYSPGNTGSALYGQVVPDRKTQLRTNGTAGEGFDFVDGSDFEFVDGDSFDTQGTPARVIWTGRTDDFSYNPDPEALNVGVSCLGNLSRLRGKTINTAVYQNILTSDFLNHVLDAADWPADERNIQTGLTMMSFAWSPGEDAFDLVERIRSTEGPQASLYEDANGWIVFENRDARDTQTRSTVAQATFTAAANITAFGYNSNFKDVIEAAVIQVDERQIQGQTVIWELGSAETWEVGETKRFQVVASDPFVNAILPSSTPNDTVQTLTADATLTAGTFKLKFRRVVAAAAIDWDSTAAEIQTSLESLSTIGAGNVRCEGGPINTTPVSVTFEGVFAGLAVTDLIETVESTLNPTSVPASIEVKEEVAGNGVLSEKQALRPSAPLTSGTFVINMPEEHPFTTGTLNYNDSAATIQAAIRLSGSWGSVTCIGGPLSTGSPVIINMIYSDDLALATITSSVMASVPMASISAAITTQGGVPDYVITAGGPVSWSFNRTSGGTVQLTGTAGALGATMPGLRVRGQLVSVVRSHQVSFPEDVTDIPAGKIYRPNVRPEITLENARQFVEMFVARSSVPRTTVTAQVITKLSSASNDSLYAREVSDRIHLTMPHLHIDSDWHIEQIRQRVEGMSLVTEFGCEEIPQVGAPPLFWY